MTTPDEVTASALARLEAAEKLVYVPGAWRCAKCSFRLVQSNLNANTGTVTARDDPGDKCPNDGAPLWRVTYREDLADAYDRWEEQVRRAVAAEAERDTLADRADRAEAERALYPSKPNNRAGFSTEGVAVEGDRASIDRVRQWHHAATGRLPYFEGAYHALTARLGQLEAGLRETDALVDRAWIAGATAGYRVGYHQALQPEGEDPEALNRLLEPRLSELAARALLSPASAGQREGREDG